MLRRFCRPDTWKCIQAEILKPKPNGVKVRNALQHRVDSGESLFGGSFSPATLKAYRSDETRPWIRIKAQADTVQREVTTLQLRCSNVSAEECAARDRHPGRDTFNKYIFLKRQITARGALPAAYGQITPSNAHWTHSR